MVDQWVPNKCNNDWPVSADQIYTKSCDKTTSTLNIKILLMAAPIRYACPAKMLPLLFHTRLWGQKLIIWYILDCKPTRTIYIWHCSSISKLIQLAPFALFYFFSFFFFFNYFISPNLRNSRQGAPLLLNISPKETVLLISLLSERS